jgi:hypothetical protein
VLGISNYEYIITINLRGMNMAYRSKSMSGIKKWAKKRALDLQFKQFYNMIGKKYEPEFTFNQSQEDFNKEFLGYLEEQNKPKTKNNPEEQDPEENEGSQNK